MRAFSLIEAAGEGYPGLAAKAAAMKIGTGALVVSYQIPYLLAGVILGINDEYFRGINTFNELAEAGLALFLWPLVLIGIDLRF